jgi:hypothetical protein
MVRLAAFSGLVALALQAPAQMVTHGAPASALSPTPDGMVTHGAPASAISPTPDGREHGAPASAISPTPLPPGVNLPLHPVFTTRRPIRPLRPGHRRPVLVPVPIFYSTYAPGYDYAYPSVADPQVDPSTDAEAASEESEAQVATSEEALRYAYLQGARDALAQEKDKDKDSARMKPSPAKHDPFVPAAKSDPDPKPVADSSPATVFIFKDGHKIETRNFAIMGTTLYDMSGASLRKIQLTDLDTAATMKANDDNGITVKLP